MEKIDEKYHKVSAGGNRKKKDGNIRCIDIDNNIKALYDANNKILVSYLFNKEEYTITQAKEWAKKNKGSKIYEEVASLHSLVIDQQEQLEKYKKEVMAAIGE